MRNLILPLYCRWRPDLFKEIIVVGEYEEGEGYTYVPCPSVFRNCGDALLQRQMGFDALKYKRDTDWILFQHDDHLWCPDNQLDNHEQRHFDVLSVSRWTRENPEYYGGRLPDGAFPNKPPILQYVNGHACLMRPNVFLMKQFKWTDAPPIFTWDVKVTQRLEKVGAKIRYTPEYRVWDCERNAKPWE